MNALQIWFVTLLATAPAPPARAETIPPVTPAVTVTLQDANRMIRAALAEAETRGVSASTVAVVDGRGHLVAVQRLDGASAASTRLAIRRALTAVLWQKSRPLTEAAMRHARTRVVLPPDFRSLHGAVPVVEGTRVIGAIGVGGAASAEQDDKIALAGAGAAGSFEQLAVDVP